MANVNFDDVSQQLPDEDGTVLTRKWLKYKKETPNWLWWPSACWKLHFDWDVNMAEKARTVEVIITPHETSDTRGWFNKTGVTQKPAPVITDDRPETLWLFFPYIVVAWMVFLLGMPVRIYMTLERCRAVGKLLDKYIKIEIRWND